MNQRLYANFKDTMAVLRLSSGASVGYKKGTLVATYAIMTGIRSQIYVEKLMADNMPLYIEKNAIPETWSFLSDLYEISHTENDGTEILKIKR